MFENNIIYKKDFLEKFLYIVKDGEDITSIAQKFNVDKASIIADENIKSGSLVIINSKPNIVHIVKPLEDIEIISKKYGVTPEHILKKNKITKIFIGQQLFI